MQLYPGWSARDNYGTHSKNKKKRKGVSGSSPYPPPGVNDFSNSASPSAPKLHASEGHSGSSYSSHSMVMSNNDSGKKKCTKRTSYLSRASCYVFLCLLECMNNPKKCRARFGLEQQSQWCKPCRSVYNTYHIFYTKNQTNKPVVVTCYPFTKQTLVCVLDWPSNSWVFPLVFPYKVYL